MVYVTTAAIESQIDHFVPPGNPQTGIFKSTNGGQTWTLLQAATVYTAFPSGLQGNVGFMDLESGGPVAPDLLYATEYFGGIYKSTNGGNSWDLITPAKPEGGAACPAPVPDFTYFNNRFYLLKRFELRGDLPDFSRIEIGVAPSNPNVVYAGYSVESMLLDADDDGSFDPNKDIETNVGLVFKTTDGGQNWTWLGDWGRGGAPEYCGDQCSYGAPP